MNWLELYRLKLRQFFHDPPLKALWIDPLVARDAKRQFLEDVATRRRDPRKKSFIKHEEGGKRIFRYLTGRAGKVTALADHISSGADRPMLYAAYSEEEKSQGKGYLRQYPVKFAKHPLVTHPLTPAHLDLKPLVDSTEALFRAYHTELETKVKDLKDQSQDLMRAAMEKDLVKDAAWQDEVALRWLFLASWRRFPLEPGEDVDSHSNFSWPVLLPAETRAPDCNLHDHIRMTSALAFLQKREDVNQDDLMPWFVRISIGPVQSFIASARTSSDLWLSSFLVSEMAFAAILPLLEHYGPDAVLYPSLRGNSRVDAWLRGLDPPVLSKWLAPKAITRAALIPDSFCALVPRGGGETHFPRLEDLVEACRERMQAAWMGLSSVVRAWILERVQVDHTEIGQQWDAQIAQCPFELAWTATPWSVQGTLNHPEAYDYLKQSAQREVPKLREDIQQEIKAIKQRQRAYEKWVPKDALAFSEETRAVFGKLNCELFNKGQGGFDYALRIYQLHMMHTSHKLAQPQAPQLKNAQGGIMCSRCGLRLALAAGSAEGSQETLREKARTLWQNRSLDPERTGSERLCAVCSTRRFLAQAWSGEDPIKEGVSNDQCSNPWMIWHGDDGPKGHAAQSGRVPFPSTAMLAAQHFLAALADPDFNDPCQAVVAAAKAAKFPKTAYVKALPRLQRALATTQNHAAIHQLLQYEPQWFDHRRKPEHLLRLVENSDQEAKVQAFCSAVQDLHSAYRNKQAAEALPDFQRHVAVIVLDLDGLSKLMVGASERLRVKWKDVMHPKFVAYLENKTPEKFRTYHKKLCDAGWHDLLHIPRPMGPSTHSLITRSLAFFAHAVVPWVVEREFGGRLIYAGGDDVLALAPAKDALGIATRLQQLLTAPWIVDRSPNSSAWEEGNRADLAVPELRFLVPLPQKKDSYKLDDPKTYSCQPRAYEASLNLRQQDRLESLKGAVFMPMLGPYQSLSGALVYGHYKRSLGPMIQTARDLMRRHAKDQLGGGHLVLSHASRNGDKSQFALPWQRPLPTEWTPDSSFVLEMPSRFWTVTQAFYNHKIPGRLPYKLRELGPALAALRASFASKGAEQQQSATGQATKNPFEQEKASQLLRGMLTRAWDESGAGNGGSSAPQDLRRDVLKLWQSGLHHVLGQDLAAGADGLMLCRALGAMQRGQDLEGDA